MKVTLDENGGAEVLFGDGQPYRVFCEDDTREGVLRVLSNARARFDELGLQENSGVYVCAPYEENGLTGSVRDNVSYAIRAANVIADAHAWADVYIPHVAHRDIAVCEKDRARVMRSCLRQVDHADYLVVVGRVITRGMCAEILRAWRVLFLDLPRTTDDG
jgi:hypothetical protein